MKKNYIQIIAVLIIVVFIGIAFFGNSKNNRDVSEDKSNNTAYSEYTNAKLQQSLKKGDTILFFWASWCPTCAALDRELKESIGVLPKDLTVLKVDYDSEKDLKKKFNIVQQHTLVLLDNQGNEKKKWVGGGVALIEQQLK